MKKELIIGVLNALLPSMLAKPSAQDDGFLNTDIKGAGILFDKKTYDAIKNDILTIDLFSKKDLFQKSQTRPKNTAEILSDLFSRKSSLSSPLLSYDKTLKKYRPTYSNVQLLCKKTDNPDNKSEYGLFAICNNDFSKAINFNLSNLEFEPTRRIYGPIAELNMISSDVNIQHILLMNYIFYLISILILLIDKKRSNKIAFGTSGFSFGDFFHSKNISEDKIREALERISVRITKFLKDYCSLKNPIDMLTYDSNLRRIADQLKPILNLMAVPCIDNKLCKEITSKIRLKLSSDDATKQMFTSEMLSYDKLKNICKKINELLFQSNVVDFSAIAPLFEDSEETENLNEVKRTEIQDTKIVETVRYNQSAIYILKSIPPFSKIKDDLSQYIMDGERDNFIVCINKKGKHIELWSVANLRKQLEKHSTDKATLFRSCSFSIRDGDGEEGLLFKIMIDALQYVKQHGNKIKDKDKLETLENIIDDNKDGRQSTSKKFTSAVRILSGRIGFLFGEKNETYGREKTEYGEMLIKGSLQRKGLIYHVNPKDIFNE